MLEDLLPNFAFRLGDHLFQRPPKTEFTEPPERDAAPLPWRRRAPVAVRRTAR